MAGVRKPVQGEEQMIKHIIFDLGNVLVNIHPKEVMEEFRHICSKKKDKVAEFFLSKFHYDYMTGKYSSDEFYQKLNDTFEFGLDFPSFVSIWNKVIGAPKDGIEDVVLRLNSNFILSVCSNTDPLHWNFCIQNYPFISGFKHYFLSFELGLRKPDQRIFRVVIERLKTTPNECLFIDDTYENITKADKMGFHTIHATNPEAVIAGVKQLKLF
jgi:putative hydrolase of the HAD superfamily